MAIGLRDIAFGLTESNGVFPVVLDGPDSVGDVILIATLTSPGEFPWLPDFGVDLSVLAFQNATDKDLGSKALDILRQSFSSYLPFVTIVDAKPKTKIEGGNEIRFIEVRYVYRGVPGTVEASLGGI
jgi:hypothetical protein